MNSHFHFLGICGTAMGAVAAAMARRGFTVTGSDANVYPPMSTFLEEEGITLFEGYKASNIPADADVIVIGNAMSRGNEEVEAVLQRRLRYLSLPETMKEYFLRGKRNYVVTGTHGKTTTTSMLAWLMEDSGLNPSFMIGGIARNLGRGGRFTDSDFSVLEGDEYDTAFFDKRSKFLHYLPELVVINNIEFDHADIYNSLEEIKLSFRRLTQIIPRNGLALVNADDPNCLDVVKGAPCPVKTLGFSDSSNIRILDVETSTDGSHFTLEGTRYYVPMIGEFNIRNAAMAIAAAQFAGLNVKQLADSMGRFEGVARARKSRAWSTAFPWWTTSPTTPRPSSRPSWACASATRDHASGPFLSRAPTPRAETSSRMNWPCLSPRRISPWWPPWTIRTRWPWRNAWTSPNSPMTSPRWARTP